MFQWLDTNQQHEKAGGVKLCTFLISPNKHTVLLIVDLTHVCKYSHYVPTQCYNVHDICIYMGIGGVGDIIVILESGILVM